MNPERSNVSDINERRRVSGEVIDMNLAVAEQFVKKIGQKAYTKLEGTALADKLGHLLNNDRKISRLIDTGSNNLDNDEVFDDKIQHDDIMQMLVGILNDTRPKAKLYKHERHITNQLLYMRGALPNETPGDQLWFSTVDRMFDQRED